MPVNSCVGINFAGGLLQKKGINTDIVHCPEIIHVNDVSCVDKLSFIQTFPIVAPCLPVGARLYQFGGGGGGGEWADPGASP